jgi:hypothetical protein
MSSAHSFNHFHADQKFFRRGCALFRLVHSFYRLIEVTKMTKTTEILESLGIRPETNRALVISALAAMSI